MADVGLRCAGDASSEDPSDRTRSEPFAHGPVAWSLLLPRSSEELFDQAQFDSDERLPYWADLWPSSRALARWILDAPSLPDAAIDLGCGVGLNSLALASRGVRAIATDYEPLALRFVVENARRNGLAPPLTRCLDWRHPPDDLQAPLVVGADLLYERRNAEALARLLPAIVPPGGRAILADPRRPWRRHFSEAMASAGWDVRERDATSESGPTGHPVSIVFVDCLRDDTAATP